MVKVVYNNCFGGFGLSREAILLARELSGNPKWGDCVLKGEKYENGEKCDFEYGGTDNISRHDPILVKVVEKLGSKKASGMCAKLAIQELEDGSSYRVDEYDGSESIMTRDDYDWISTK